MQKSLKLVQIYNNLWQGDIKAVVNCHFFTKKQNIFKKNCVKCIFLLTYIIFACIIYLRK